MSVYLFNLPPGFRLSGLRGTTGSTGDPTYTLTHVATGATVDLRPNRDTTPGANPTLDGAALDSFVAAHWTPLSGADFDTYLAAGRFNPLLRDTS